MNTENSVIEARFGAATRQTCMVGLNIPQEGNFLLEVLNQMAQRRELKGNLHVNTVLAEQENKIIIQIGVGKFSFVIKDPITPAADPYLLVFKRYNVISLVHFSTEVEPELMYRDEHFSFDFQFKLMNSFGDRLNEAITRFVVG